MPKKINCLIFSDFEIPNYDRPYRGILFLEWSDNSKYNFYIVSPFTETKFQKPSHNIKVFYYQNDRKIKGSQYRIGFRIINLWRLMNALIEFKLKSIEIDLVYAGTTYLLLFAGLFKGKKTKIIANICDFYSDLYSGYKMPFGSLLKYPIKLIETVALSFADVITVDTTAQKLLLVSNYKINHDKCVVLPNGLIVEKFPYLETKEERVMKNYNFSQKDFIFFYGGDISEDDGVEFIIKFAHEFKFKENFKFLIIGKGNNTYISKLNNSISDLGLSEKVTIDTFKPIDELYRYISVADVCLAPFKVTNTTNVTEVGKIITYMLGGKKVLSTKADGVCSLYGSYINYFRDGDYDDFKTKLLQLTNIYLSNEERLKIRRHAEKFDFKTIINTEYEIVDRILKQNTNVSDLNFKI